MALEAMLDGRKPPCSCSDEKIGAIFCADRIVARDTIKIYRGEPEIVASDPSQIDIQK